MRMIFKGGHYKLGSKRVLKLTMSVVNLDLRVMLSLVSHTAAMPYAAAFFGASFAKY